MIAFLPQPITLTSSSIADDDTSLFDKTEGLIVGAKRQYNNRIYETLNTIDPLAHYIFSDEDPVSTIHYVKDLHNETEVYQVGGVLSIGVVSGSTIVYRKSNIKYYKSLQTATVDFMIEDFSNGVNWEELGTSPAFRHEYIYSQERKSTLDWSDKGATNKYTMLDGSLNKQSTHPTDCSIEFTATGIDRIAVFNVFCDEVEVIGTLDDLTEIYRSTKQMLNTDSIIDFETYCFDEIKAMPRAIWSIPKDYSVNFEIIFKGTDVKIGEVLIGRSMFIGVATDTATLKAKSYSQIIESTNGDVFFDEGDSQLKIKEEVNYEVVFDTNTINAQTDLNKKLINKKLVVSGSDMDDENLRFLVTYGYGKDFALKPKMKFDKSTYNFQFISFL